MAGLLVLALLYQAAFLVFAFSARADGDGTFHLPFCTGAGIVWIDSGDLTGSKPPAPDQEADRSDAPICPLCGPAAAPLPELPAYAAPGPDRRAPHLAPRDRRAGSGAVRSTFARAPPRSA